MAFVLYNGERKWTGPSSFSELIDVPTSLAPFAIEFRVMLIDLRALSVEQLAGERRLAGGLLALKAATAPADERQAVIVESLRRLKEHPSTQKTFVSYLRRVGSRTARPALEEALRRMEEGAEMKTIDDVVFDRGARHGMKKGLEKGLEKGMREGKRDALCAVLEARFSKKVTARTLARLERADPPTLDRWLRRAAKARSLDAVFS